MNEIAVHLRYGVTDAGGLNHCDISALNHHLRRTLHNRGGYVYPARARCSATRCARLIDPRRRTHPRLPSRRVSLRTLRAACSAATNRNASKRSTFSNRDRAILSAIGSTPPLVEGGQPRTPSGSAETRSTCSAGAWTPAALRRRQPRSSLSAASYRRLVARFHPPPHRNRPLQANTRCSPIGTLSRFAASSGRGRLPRTSRPSEAPPIALSKPKLGADYFGAGPSKGAARAAAASRARSAG
jgi:hypothetical protein